MALGLQDGPPPAAGQRPHREVVGEGAGGHEHRALLAEQRREPLLELAHDAAVRVAVAGDAPFLGEPAEDPAVVERRQAQAVAGHSDPAVARLDCAPGPDAAALARGQTGPSAPAPRPSAPVCRNRRRPMDVLLRVMAPLLRDVCRPNPKTVARRRPTALPEASPHGGANPYSGGSRYASSRPGWPLPLVATTMYCTPSST